MRLQVLHFRHKIICSKIIFRDWHLKEVSIYRTTTLTKSYEMNCWFSVAFSSHKRKHRLGGRNETFHYGSWSRYGVQNNWGINCIRDNIRDNYECRFTRRIQEGSTGNEYLSIQSSLTNECWSAKYCWNNNRIL